PPCASHPPTSTRSPRSTSRKPWRPPSRAGPAWSSPTGCRPSSTPTGSWSSTTAGSASRAAQPTLSPPGGPTPPRPRAPPPRPRPPGRRPPARRRPDVAGDAAAAGPTSLFQGYVFDLDGPLYLGDELLPGAGRLLSRLRELERRVAFVSNNPTRDP